MGTNKTVISKDRSTGKFYLSKVDKHDNLDYQQALVEAMNFFYPLFQTAKSKNEYPFILTLLRVKKNEAPGWDTLETLRDAYKTFTGIRDDISFISDALPHFSMYTYGLIVEAREPYEMIYNLLNIIEGNQYKIKNIHEDTVPKDIVQNIIRRSSKLGFDASFMDKMYDNKVRNAVFHSDFTYSPDYFRIPSSNKEYSKSEILSLVNHAYAYLEVFFRIYDQERLEYQESEILEVTGDNKIFEIRTIVRAGTGLIGIRDNFTKSEIKAGAKPMRVGKYTSREKKLIDDGICELPATIESKVNRLIQKFPRRMRSTLVRLAKQHLLSRI